MGNIPPPPPPPPTPQEAAAGATTAPSPPTPPPSTLQGMPEPPKLQGEGEGPPPGQDPDPKLWEKDGNVIPIDVPNAWEKYRKFVKDPGCNTLAVVEFAATWCGPSRFIEPFIVKQAQANKDVMFLRLNFDSMEAAATELEVDVVPTFLLYKGGVRKSKIVGARRWDLSNEIQKYKNETT